MHVNEGFKPDPDDYKMNSSNRSQPHSTTFKKTGVCGGRTQLERILLFLVFVLLVAVIIIAIVFATNVKDTDSSSGASASTGLEDICMTEECTSTAARVLADIDTTVNPCDNFYEFSCGKWIKKAIIPEDRSSINKFGELRDDVDATVKYLLEEEIKPGDVEAVNKAKRLYMSCMNESLIETLGISVVMPLLQELGGWPVVNSSWTEASFNMTTLLVTLAKHSNYPGIGFFVYTDLKNSNRRLLYVDQPGLGMPGRRYYEKGRNDPMVLAYEQLVKDVTIAFGADATTAQNDAKAIVDFEMELANITMPPEDRRDSEALYNKMTIAQLAQNFSTSASPNVRFEWLWYLQGIMHMKGVEIPITESENIIVYAVPYFNKLFNLLSKHNNRVIANYLVWRIMQYRIGNLGKQFQELTTKYNKVLFGTEVPTARWRTCSAYANSIMGLAVGRLFVRESFDEHSKADTLEMIGNLKSSFNSILNELDWMDDSTRTVARAKAEYIQNKIGYEDYILDDAELNRLYENYTADQDKYFENVLNNLMRSSIDSHRLLRTPVDKTEWRSPPSTVNAFYNFVLNRIMFPAGILQPPFYYRHYPKSMNYGGIGVVIGHEITHGFDDMGRQYDKDGNLVQWWSDNIISNFKSRAQCLINQYGNFTVPEADGMQLNGFQTQGENIADNGGLKQSFRAYRQWVKAQGKEEKKLPGIKYTHNQLFFLNFAQIWCVNMRKQSAINRILTGVHSPGRFRVIGTLQNSPDFAEAFNCPQGSYMNPVKKCGVW